MIITTCRHCRKELEIKDIIQRREGVIYCRMYVDSDGWVGYERKEDEVCGEPGFSCGYCGGNVDFDREILDKKQRKEG
ncbi:MAG: hypothetical protein DDT41_01694 [candidate division WS2 bacterium]|nr:hypothetical protein [Candidatus Psychracetigena formicireducens]